jgi:hypothetical protein
MDDDAVSGSEGEMLTVGLQRADSVGVRASDGVELAVRLQLLE